MIYVVIDTRDNVRVFKTKDELETFLRSHNGIFYVIEKNWKWFKVNEIYNNRKITERIVDVLD